MAQIQKIKNFEGYWLTCSRCGREIKHAFTVDGLGQYGSECVFEVAGYAGDKGVRKIMSRVRILAKYEKTGDSQLDRMQSMADAYGVSTDDIKQGFIHTGKYKPL